MMDNKKTAWAEIDLKAIQHNIRSIKNRAAGAKIMAVVKANAYGHGMLEVTRVCLQEGIDFLGVSNLDEALALREAGVDVPVMVLGYIPGQYAEVAVEKNIRVTVFDWKLADALSQAAVKLDKKAYLHVKVDTGMGRIGFLPEAGSLDIISRIAALPMVCLEGIFTHFVSADAGDKSFTYRQLELFAGIVSSLERQGIFIPLKHCANSAALMEVPESLLNMVRAGIVIYGLYPSPEVKREKLDIIPAMTLKSRVSFVKTLDAGATVSYGRTYRCTRRTRVATVPIGYADGYSRLLSNRAWAVIKGKRVPLIGVVCMDQCMFDVTGIEEVTVGDEVILFGRPEDGVTADDLAEIMGTINYEIVCSVGSRIPRIYK